MRYKKNPLEVIKLVEQRIEEVEKSLPEGVRVETFYDRTNLIVDAVKTLSSILTAEIIITVIILLLFLWNF